MTNLVTISVAINRDDLPEHNEEEFIEWAKYKTGCKAVISDSNPLADCDLCDHTNPYTFRMTK